MLQSPYVQELQRYCIDRLAIRRTVYFIVGVLNPGSEIKRVLLFVFLLFPNCGDVCISLSNHFVLFNCTDNLGARYMKGPPLLAANDAP